MAVVTILKKGDKFLLQRRGPGCPDNIGKLCCSCGYLNWGETLKQAAIRELYEETGLLIQEKDIKPWKLIDDPKRDDRENVSLRFVATIFSSEFSSPLTFCFCTPKNSSGVNPK